MSHLFDGSPCSFVPHGAAHSLVAIGWLEAAKPFPIGTVPDKFFRCICAHLASPWQPPFAYAGHHQCDICQFGTATSTYSGHKFSSHSASELFIPTGSSIYVSPVNIAHYIGVHRYRPPEDYISAVLACPPQRTMAHLKLLLDSGGRSWLEAVQTPPE